ncbi:MAG: Gfo/Idh/MocA family oxidoreductase [Steroidobacteraceae bacterium]
MEVIPLKALNVGIIGTGAIANLHARAYKNLGYNLRVCTDVNEPAGRRFASAHGVEFLDTYEDVCRHPDVDYVDVCTFPDFRLQPVELCAAHGKHVQVQKPMATNLATARRMIEVARGAGILLGVVSQHRFDVSSEFLASAIPTGRLGRLLQCDAYVKWHRTAEYYSRPVKGSWATEGGGALINQAIHQVDLLRWLAGPVAEVFGSWQLGALHKIESEDVLSAVMRFTNGATGVIQASTAMWPGYPERIELHGTKGTAIVAGDKLITWDVMDDAGDPPPLASRVESGASDPMAIGLEPFERQFTDFGNAIAHARQPRVSGKDGYEALELVDAIYRSCRSGEKVTIA